MTRFDSYKYEKDNSGYCKSCNNLSDEITRLTAECERLRGDYQTLLDDAVDISHEVEQTLGKVLGYPWYKDDLKNFPDATEADGVCVGDHVPETLAMAAAHRIEKLEALLKEISMQIDSEVYLTKGGRMTDFEEGYHQGLQFCAAIAKRRHEK